MKILLVFYLNIGNIPSSEVDEYVQRTMSITKLDKEEYETYYIPVRTGETRIECINPVVTPKDDYEKIKAELDRLTNLLPIKSIEDVRS